MPPRSVTIKDLAKILEISVSTVSRALRDTYDVNTETKKRVLALAAELQYKPNFNATGLASGSTHNIGIIIPFIANYYFSTVITGIQDVAYSKGYNITLFVTNDSPERELSILDNLTLANLDGLLVSISADTADCRHYQEIINYGIPVVFFDRVPAQIETSKVMQDDYNGAFEAVEHLIAQGYTKIAHIAGPKNLSFTEKRWSGYIDALTKHQLKADPDWVVYSGFSQECGENDTEKLLSLPHQPDAIFAANDRKAIGAMITLKKHGIAVGEVFGVVGFTNDPMAQIISPALTTIAEPAFEIGKKSCELLISHLTKTYFQPQEIILPGKLIVRASSYKRPSH